MRGDVVGLEFTDVGFRDQGVGFRDQVFQRGLGYGLARLGLGF
jgi:hypothetical protein